MKKIKRPTAKIPIISFFCGCGGFDLGFVNEDYRVLLALDINEDAVESYNRNHGRTVAKVCDLSLSNAHELVAMICQKSLESPRGIIGGAPCQSFSNSNVHRKKRDPRHSLPRTYARLLKDLNRIYGLDFFVFENVEGLNSKNHRNTFYQFKTLFKKAGFNLFLGKLDALHFGVPQRRPRLFLVGLNAEKYPGREFTFPVGNPRLQNTVRSKIRKLPKAAFFSKRLSPEKIRHHPNHWTMQPKSAKFANGLLKEGQTCGRSFRVLSWDKPSWTVAYGHREIHIHPNCRRRLTVYEAMLLQGLPAWYKLSGSFSAQVQQVSDMMPAQVGAALARQIRNCLEL
jgi:DNA (cytosine-5)-methyltransferase 1